MQTIDHFNLRSFDLNLLVAFDAMMEEMNVTRAARRLKIQQPAMSHNISTLRTLFQDELFIRVGQEMKPTARALKLASGKSVRIPRSGIAGSADGAMIGMTAADLEASAN